MRDIDKIVIHCSATKPELKITVKNIRRWHMEDNGWSDIGYHYVIGRDGLLEKGRDIDKVGAHVLGHNATSIGVCLVGGVDNQGSPRQNYTAYQYYTLKKLLDVLCVTFPNADIMGHNDLDSAKDCPCFDVRGWWDGIVEK